MMNNIEQLLEAAKILEKRDEAKKRCSTPIKMVKKTTRRSPSYSRTTHNQLEKNRRAHLRDCLELLKDLVPSPPEHQKATTLALLQSAQQYIKVLQSSEREAIESKKKLAQEQMFLRRKLLLLKGDSELKRPRSSEGDSTTSEEIDVENDEETGYASGESDDIYSTASIASEGSEGDLMVNTRIGIQVS
ncbi:max-interacting protein 1-like isoform X2 [Actinia tenebrosa]|uniref:Max-interacting protein 1-like isoform X1 n=1 Tax=Actinia tenebrosa TaxID=6105 RepID=A0A6P8IQ00_ACTTE|nr:max-interacting protein 1-like isoform X1 [Actinia tenebrosa]XP_031568958.1 max-interacting protein 1-like isoform X2 [Actinia tenebrosa]